MGNNNVTKLSAFSMDCVENSGDYCKNALEKDVLYLTAFDVDKLLAGFRETAGLDTKGATRYEGWEVMLIGGHTMGHYLSAMAQAYVNPGVSEEDKKTVYEMLTACVDGLLECQNNSKGKPGFVFGAAILDAENVEVQFDNIEKNMTNIITQAWVPWYTMHKLLAGLVEVYDLTKYEPALTVARGIGDWSYNRTMGWDEETHRTVIGIEFGGMNEALYDLYRLTDDERYAVTAHMFDPRDLYLKVASGDENVLNNHHANTTIPKFIGALNRYLTCHGKKIEGEITDAEEYLVFAEKFWDMVVERHTYITGGNSEWEHFGVDYILDKERTNCNCETCNIYNMLKLSRMLFMVTGNVKYADFYENAYFNTILSSQNPENGMTTYFQPMATGFFKVYGERFNKFWCCTGTGMENFTKLNDSIFFHDENTVFVNVYESAKLIWTEKNLELDMRTSWEEGGKAAITVKTTGGTNDANAAGSAIAMIGMKADASLALRCPDWLSGEMAVSINGEPACITSEDGFVVLPELSNGDVIEVFMSAKIVAHALPDNKNSVAFKYGPFVLSADLGMKDMVTTTTGVNVTIPLERVTDYDYIVLREGISAEEFEKNADSYFEKTTDSNSEMNARRATGEEDLSGGRGLGLKFKLTLNGLVFAPHYLRYKERYGIYFLIADKSNDGNGRERRVIDTIQPGYGQYENDALHQLSDNGSVGTTNGETSRYATAGGNFSYYITVNPSEKNYLSLTLLKNDDRTLKVTSGETILFCKEGAAAADDLPAGDSYEVLVEIPDEVVKAAKDTYVNHRNSKIIPITFSGIDGKESAKVADFIYMINF